MTHAPGLSILIPVYNYPVGTLVSTLSAQAAALTDGTPCEIVVADDGSPQGEVKRKNRAVAGMPLCRLIELPQNVGRARVRNLLAREAAYSLLLYLDSDVRIRTPRFLATYLSHATAPVVCGGWDIPRSAELRRRYLRYRYEEACLPKFTAERRAARPYGAFRTTNFLISASVMLAHPFDEAITTYGYEDVMMGRALSAAHIGILHIDNPVEIADFEDNADYLQKVDESVRTLVVLKDKMQGYSALLALARRLHRLRLSGLLRPVLRLCLPRLRRRLEGRNGRVWQLQLYRLMLSLARL